MYEIATNLHRFLNGSTTFYISLTPEIPDFTANKEFIISFHLPNKKLDITVSQANILDVCSAVQQFAFKKDNIIFCWNIKELFTYAKFYTKTLVPCESSLLDIALIERFYGIVKTAPETYLKALDRARTASQISTNWKKVYNKLFLPLTKEVIPSIETTPLLNIESGKLVYSHYQINGQSNGRCLCASVYSKSFNPHTMGDDLKSILSPVGYGKLFLYCDYRQMEVSVLCWLSKDPVLGTMLKSGKDFYKSLHVLLFGDKCKSQEDRQKCKMIFLPVIYGQSPQAMANKLSISEAEACSIVERLRKVFRVAFEWVEGAKGEDYFGRKRDFSESPYKARNFSIQAPAAMFCLEKLIALYRALSGAEAEVVYNIHDGYGIICKKNNYKEVFAIALEVLESYSELMPELAIGVSGQIGLKLDKMISIESFRDENNSVCV